MNSFGRNFRVSIFGESHGPSVGITIDHCPAGISLEPIDFEGDLSRRRSGKKGTTPRKEPDIPNIVSGVFKGKTTGSPITIMFENTNTRSEDYEKLKDIPRPGHADFVAEEKFSGYQDYRGGGHFSGRITLGLVAAGIIAKKTIDPIQLYAQITEVGGKKDIEQSLNKAMEDKDSIGGIIECKGAPMPIGLGEPFFDSLESLISHIIFSIPGIRGIEFGAGFHAARTRGKEHNDCILNSEGRTKTNHSGGINGGISNGNDLVFRVAVKPTSSISIPQHTFSQRTGKMEMLEISGRHDSCIALRMPVIVEAAAAIVLADLMYTERK
jgi:chorismate synthase